MNRYYLDEIKKLGDVSGDSFSPDDERHELWKAEREKFGFDGRDTWALNFTMAEMLYERLRMYLEKADDIVNLSYHTYEFEGKMYTQRELILEMIADAETFLKFEYNAVEELQDDDFEDMTEEEIYNWNSLYARLEIEALEARQRLWKIWAIVQDQMWW